MSGSQSYEEMKPVQRLINCHAPNNTWKERAQKEYDRLKARKETMSKIREIVFSDSSDLAETIVDLFDELGDTLETINDNKYEQPMGC